MVEQEQTHRIKYEETMLNATVNDTQRGHYLGSAISLVALISATYSAYIGAHPAVSIALVSIPVLSTIKAIISNKTNK